MKCIRFLNYDDTNKRLKVLTHMISHQIFFKSVHHNAHNIVQLELFLFVNRLLISTDPYAWFYYRAHQVKFEEPIKSFMNIICFTLCIKKKKNIYI